MFQSVLYAHIQASLMFLCFLVLTGNIQMGVELGENLGVARLI
jgi:hypothetical protein